MNLFQWMKRHRAGQQIKAAAATGESSKKDGSLRRRRHLNNKMNRSDTGTSDETTTNSTTEDAPWRIEKLLPMGAPQASDWWIERQDLDETLDTSAETVSDCNDDENDDDSPGSAHGTRQFHNCGLATWNQTRSVWKDYHETDASGNNIPCDPPTKAAALTKSQKKELVKVISSYRTYQLRQRIGLKDMIETYNEMWSNDLE